MTADRMPDRVITHLCAHVAELRRLEREGADSGELDERRQVIARLHKHLADMLRDSSTPR